MAYKIMGMDFENFDAIELHETDSVERANSWIVGYVRENNYDVYDAITVVAPNGFTKAEFSRDYGWIHY